MMQRKQNLFLDEIEAFQKLPTLLKKYIVAYLVIP